MSQEKLTWIPLLVDGSTAPPELKYWKDFQVGWFWNLFWASLNNKEFPGYLPAARSNLWIVAGAHRPAHWDANCAVVMAAFELRELEGRKMLCYPPLIEILEEQKKKLRNHKKRNVRNLNNDPQGSGEYSPSQSEFVFDLQQAEVKTEIKIKEERYGGTNAAGTSADPYTQGKRARRVEQTRNVLRESLRRYSG